MIARKPSVKARPDLSGAAPANCAWSAYDENTYDGAPDAGRQTVGWGSTAEEALADYDAELESETTICVTYAGSDGAHEVITFDDMIDARVFVRYRLGADDIVIGTESATGFDGNRVTCTGCALADLFA